MSNPSQVKFSQLEYTHPYSQHVWTFRYSKNATCSLRHTRIPTPISCFNYIRECLLHVLIINISVLVRYCTLYATNHSTDQTIIIEYPFLTALGPTIRTFLSSFWMAFMSSGDSSKSNIYNINRHHHHHHHLYSRTLNTTQDRKPS